MEDRDDGRAVITIVPIDLCRDCGGTKDQPAIMDILRGARSGPTPCDSKFHNNQGGCNEKCTN